MADYSIWALEFARLPGYPDAALVLGKHDGSRMLSFYYFVVQSEDRVILIDSGFSDNDFCSEQIDAYGIEEFSRPDKIMARIGLTPEDVDTIIITHHHWDHISGLNYFPNANVYIQQREVDNWMAKWGTPGPMRWLAFGLDPGTAADLARIGEEGRLRLVQGVADVTDGIQVRPAFDTHTAGSHYIVVEAGDGGAPFVFPGDVAYVYDNIGGLDGTEPMAPVGHLQGSTECCIRSTYEMLTTAGNDSTRVFPSHENRLWDRLPSISFDDGLHVAEIQLAPGVASRIGR
jgi:glyoxylase-like metal-dependent hydrolase (beta-lactamase superfamily II)